MRMDFALLLVVCGVWVWATYEPPFQPGERVRVVSNTGKSQPGVFVRYVKTAGTTSAEVDIDDSAAVVKASPSSVERVRGDH